MSKHKTNEVKEAEGTVYYASQTYLYRIHVDITDIVCPKCAGFLVLDVITNYGEEEVDYILNEFGNPSEWFYAEAYCNYCLNEKREPLCFLIPVTSKLKTIVKYKPNELELKEAS